MDYLFLGVGRLGEAAQKHHRSSDVLASSSELRGVVPSIQDVTLDLTGVTPSAARWVARMWRLALSPLSLLLVVLLRTRQGLHTGVRRGVSL